MQRAANTIACPCGKPVSPPRAYCSTPCKRRAQNRRARSERVLTSTNECMEGVRILTPLSEPQHAPLRWSHGKRHGLDDPRKFQAKLYPDGSDPSAYANHRAFALHLTDHWDSSRIGWYGLVLGKAVADNGWVFETGPHATDVAAKAHVEDWLSAPVQRRPIGNPLGSFLVTVCGAPSGAASVVRGTL
jgi:hypothetical protein